MTYEVGATKRNSPLELITQEEAAKLERMEEALKKLVTIHGKTVELYSLDGQSWSSDLRQLQKRMEQRRRENDKVVRDAAKFFKSRPMLSKRTKL